MHSISSKSQAGFSLIEMMIVLIVFSVAMAGVLSQLNGFQKLYRAEASKLDTTQGAREFVDQIVRDLHQSGYPSARMFMAGVLSNPPQNDAHNAVGLFALSATDLWFEADLDGDGQVESIRYTLVADPANPGNCPCLIQRSQTQKSAGIAPMSQTMTYMTALSGVVNSAGMGGSGASGSLPVSGTTVFTGSNGNHTTANDVFYAAYKTPAMFAAYDQDGNAVSLPVDFNSSPTALASVRTIAITINALGNGPELQDGSRAVISLTASARLSN